MSVPVPDILAIAGTNGAGKSSIAGEELRRRGGAYYNPDEATRRILDQDPAMTFGEANAEAWQQGRRMLERAIEHRLQHAFETTLGGETITSLLLKAANIGMPVRIWYVGLATAELHIERVARRVAGGGHDIPAATIRRRYDSSRANLVQLIPHLTELRVYDNSTTPPAGASPLPWSIVHLRKGVIEQICPLPDVPEWAKPIVRSVLTLYAGRRPR